MNLMRRPAEPAAALGFARARLAQAWTGTAAVVLAIALPLAINPWVRDAYSLPKAQVLYGLTAAIVLGAVLHLLRRRQWVMTRPEIAVWSYLLAVLISSAVSADPLPTLFGGPGRYEGLLTVACYVGLFFAGAQCFGSETAWHTLARAVGTGAIVAVTYGALELFLPPLFPAEAEVRWWYAMVGFRRFSSVLGSPVVFGGYLSLTAPILLALGLAQPGRLRLLWLGGAALAYFNAVMTSTRGAWIAVAIGTAVLVTATGRAAFRRTGGIGAAIGVGVAVAAAVWFQMAVVATPQQTASRVTTSFDTESGAVAQRLYIWGRTLDLVRARPLFGWGLETLREVFPYERSSLVPLFGLRPVTVDRAHNDLLQTAVSVGVPGAAAYAAIWVSSGVAAFRLWQRLQGRARILAAGWLAAMVAYVVQAQFSFGSVAVTPIVWLLAGASAGWEAHTSNAATRESLDADQDTGTRQDETSPA